MVESSVHNKKTSFFLALGALSLLSLAGCGDSTAPAADLVIISGNNQTAEAGTRLPDPIVVRVVSTSGSGLGAKALNFSITAGGGNVFVEDVLTDGSGVAVNFWQLGPSPDSAQTVEVRFANANGSDFVVTFSATATAPPTP